MLLNRIAVAPAAESKVEAICQASDVIGRCVYISGPEVGGKYQVSTVDPQNGSKIPSIGVIVEKLTSTTCIVQLSGALKDIVTGLTPGKALFVGAGGILSHSLPSPGISFAYVQPMGVAVDSNALLLSPSLSIIKRIA